MLAPWGLEVISELKARTVMQWAKNGPRTEGKENI